jgi:RNA polymerase sigma-70 factor (ECF subfamily)
VHIKVICLARYSSISDQELVRDCAEANDDAAWEEFVSRFNKPITLSILRIAHDWGQTGKEIVDDLVQETMLKLYAGKCRLLLEFIIRHPEAPVIGYIKTIAINLTHDYFRSLSADKHGGGHVQQFDPEHERKTKPVDSRKVIEQPVLLGQIEQCFMRTCSGPDKERDLLIFRLHYQQGMSASMIAELPEIGLSAKGVESAIFRMTRLVREELVQVRSEKPDEPEEK